jgi:hypothetical protein
MTRGKGKSTGNGFPWQVLATQEPIVVSLLLFLMNGLCYLRLISFLRGFIWALPFLAAPLSHASTLWDGPSIIYSQPTPDPTQVSNQDRITPVVWLTRAASKGLFNAYSETSAGALSPTNTEWAFGTVTNYTSLHYTNWLAWLNGASPTTLVGKQAMLHLISEDIYLSIQFTSWSAGGAGGFAYERSTPPPLVLSPASPGNRQFSFNYNANPGFAYIVEGSPDLMNWEPLVTNVASTNLMFFSDMESSEGIKFYRVISAFSP